jgi:anti-sigma-K factor RskA
MTDEDDLTAAEYVLGTLEAEERRRFLARLGRDADAVAAVTAWQERLAPLGLTAEQAPPPQLWGQLEQRMFGRPAANDNVKKLRGWRVAAVAAALVACGSTFQAWRVAHRPVAPQSIALAALSSEGHTPAMLITYDAAKQRMNVTPVAFRAQPGRSLELWLIAGTAAPKSVGLLTGANSSFGNLAIDPDISRLAVSVEPTGGSPTGAPTGPVIYSGKMLRVAPGA